MINLFKIKSIIKIIFINIFIFSCNNVSRNAICYNILRLDNNIGFKVSNDDYTFLDKIIDKAESEIKVKENYSKKEAINILKTISKIHKELGITSPLRRYGEPLSVALHDKSFDCGNYVITYLSIAQKLNLPLYAVLAPQHIFLQWKDRKNNFYWETLYDMESSKEEYIKYHHIPKNCITAGVYLKPINNIELTANYFNTLGVYLLNHTKQIANAYICLKKSYDLDSTEPEVLCAIGDYFYKRQLYDSAIKYYVSSLKINLNFYSAYNNWGLALLMMKYYDKAKINFHSALNNTNDSIKMAETYYNLGKVYFMEQNFSKAKIYFDVSLNIDDSKSYKFEDRGVCFFNLNNYDSALYDFNKAIKLENNNSLYYNNRGIAYILQGDTIDAINDFHRALVLDSTNKDAKNNYIHLTGAIKK